MIHLTGILVQAVQLLPLQEEVLCLLPTIYF